MTKIAVLDDWQGVARASADWAALMARAEVVFFADAFASEDDAAHRLADFDIVLSMRERTPLPPSLIARLPKLRLLGITGMRIATLDLAACTARGVVVCNTVNSGAGDSATAELALGLLLAAARAVPAGDAGIRAGRFQQGCRSASRSPAGRSASSGSGGSAATWRATARPSACTCLPGARTLPPSARPPRAPNPRREGGAAGTRGRDQHPSRALRAHPRSCRRGRHRADEARRDPGQHLARPDRGRGGAGGGRACAAHHRRARRVHASRCPPTTRCAPRRTRC